MKRAVVLVTVLLAPGVAAAAQSAEQIAERALESTTFAASNARAEVDLLVSRKGKIRRTRRLMTKIKRSDDETRSFIEFSAPADVAGTKFLSVEKRGSEADQFIYLPAFKKVKRVVGAQRNRSFMGTDFTYADLDGRDVDSATWKRLPDDQIGGQDCYVIEGTPKSDEEQYGKSVLWVHKKHMVPMRIDFFDKKNAKVTKRFSVKRLEQKDDRWVATDAIMTTLPKKTSTRLKIRRVDFDAQIPNEELTRRALER